ncbi:hypothetical protein GCK72_020352 [Caenorhabditis remanei]|uniref:Uncharacterized protein n=1 Tax=Caenorhabditis remanei TaxID=31234 RepID=A0A6A5GGU9_CAERE|nr:hypothetical protein GCK72_020352 [Caenorhabditis remanei]KAF1753795.1 hypothetical protein GCK72_020352 [Caenorhabditis remanei]
MDITTTSQTLQALGRVNLWTSPPRKEDRFAQQQPKEKVAKLDRECRSQRCDKNEKSADWTHDQLEKTVHCTTNVPKKSTIEDVTPKSCCWEPLSYESKHPTSNERAGIET